MVKSDLLSVCFCPAIEMTFPLRSRDSSWRTHRFLAYFQSPREASHFGPNNRPGTSDASHQFHDGPSLRFIIIASCETESLHLYTVLSSANAYLNLAGDSVFVLSIISKAISQQGFLTSDIGCP